jgi:hypothetical protein
MNKYSVTTVNGKKVKTLNPRVDVEDSLHCEHSDPVDAVIENVDEGIRIRITLCQKCFDILKEGVNAIGKT